VRFFAGSGVGVGRGVGWTVGRGVGTGVGLGAIGGWVGAVVGAATGRSDAGGLEGRTATTIPVGVGDGDGSVDGEAGEDDAPGPSDGPGVLTPPLDVAPGSTEPGTETGEGLIAANSPVGWRGEPMPTARAKVARTRFKTPRATTSRAR
jgi:hypothetical protein